jgi:Cdc6-like AAA superfamily ATPase
MIKEIENTDINISKIPMNTDYIEERIPQPLPKSLTHFLIINGPPGSGKTNIMVNLIGKQNKNYYGVYDRVYFISPSIHTIGKKINFNDERVFNNFSEEILNHIIEEEEGQDNKCLLILDDVVAQLNRNMKPMLKFIYNRRHIGGGFSVWLLAQKWNKIPLELRSCCSHTILFKPGNKKELTDFYDELCNLDKNSFNEICNYIYKDKHDFLFYDMKDYYRNFNKIIYTNNNEKEEPKKETND